jgi:hypothetical protein
MYTNNTVACIELYSEKNHMLVLEVLVIYFIFLYFYLCLLYLFANSYGVISTWLYLHVEIKLHNFACC